VTTMFLDTVGLIALWDEDDQWHGDAEEAFGTAMADRWRFVTTSFVMLECGNTAARRPFRSAACRFQAKLEGAGGLVLPTQGDWQMAWRAYERGEAGSAGIVDHVSFVVMRRLGLTHAFTNDEHFKAAGFVTLF